MSIHPFRRSAQVFVLALATVTCPAWVHAARAPQPRRSRVRIPGHTLPALAGAQRVAATIVPDSDALTLTIVLNRDDERGFDRYLRALQDPTSPHYQRFLTQAEIADRFGPSRRAYDDVRRYLRTQGLTFVEGSANRLTMVVRGTRAAVERAFDVGIADYQMGDRTFFANERDPALPKSLASHVQAVNGLASLATPQHNERAIRIALFHVGCFIRLLGLAGQNKLPATAAGIRKDFKDCVNLQAKTVGYGKIYNGTDPPAPTWRALDGTGQTIGLLEWDTFDPQDVKDFIDLLGLPASTFDNVTQVHRERRSAGGGEPSGGAARHRRRAVGRAGRQDHGLRRRRSSGAGVTSSRCSTP